MEWRAVGQRLRAGQRPELWLLDPGPGWRAHGAHSGPLLSTWIPELRTLGGLFKLTQLKI